MKNTKYLLIAFLMSACSSGPSKSQLNCEKLHGDSQAKLLELQQIFAAYQNVNYDLAVKLATPLKEQVDHLDGRVRKQKQKCWSSEKRPIDSDMALLKEELFKVYGELEPKKVRVPASRQTPAPAVEVSAPEAPLVPRSDSPADFSDID